MIKDPYEAYLGINSFLHETQIYPCELDSHHSHKDKMTDSHKLKITSINTNLLVALMRDYYPITI